jgi:hypothetical protein
MEEPEGRMGARKSAGGRENVRSSPLTQAPETVSIQKPDLSESRKLALNFQATGTRNTSKSML